jgi:hypothetical protein
VTAQDNREERRTTKAVQWLTIIAVPAGLGIAAWLANSFDTMRLNQVETLAEIRELSGDVKHHTQQLDYLYTVLTTNKAASK